MKLSYAREIPFAWKKISKVFSALSDEQRQRILLTFDRGERLNVTQITEASTLSRPAISHHLKILREAGVLASIKEGKEIFYWIDKRFLLSALGGVVDYVNAEV
ncbi:MAG TPA: metalloregulator ArsR/SmtB family transcription factor [Rhodocyclaceae bacterium]|nr:metalloregulator ArsR/SmtB family transcription factor [Rhodocyclaceae bacterium]